MQRKSLLYIGNKLSKKGSTITSIETLGAFLTKEGYCVYTASSKQNKLLRFFHMLFSTLRYSRKVSVVLIDTYSTQNFYYAVAVAGLCRALKLPYIPILRGGDLPKRLQGSKKKCNALFNGATTNVAPSLYLQEAFLSEGYSNLTYIPNTIEIDNYPFLLRKKVLPKLLWVRSFAEIYNPQLAIEVLSFLKEKGLEASLCMVGPEKDGSMEKCKLKAKALDLDVTFTGMLSKQEWIALSKNYDIFINTTNFDNTPVSVIEAMALGLPVVSTNVGGIPYLIENEKDGLLVPPDNTEALANAILKVIADETLTVSLAENARSKVEAFDWKKVKHSWLRLLNN
ncbi:glycosyltransferase involved in cell wall biosynthesis [Ulvibacter sp. MAR_2010_11]|uniref:glycosyltransferase family 4 protein n=1 Tax=Ulvibacter sp. MAR_2010_11 TaxID=1250229 RepID=UPI000C2B55AB|nr:glycosyltransferase family 4 protein [Ulvibacter sp. MAR_2010_11]PKA82104.1 glycosyltransferase involved in cell wall biosynthesis [Ulvibacter sp. MAR_2010_11]